MYDVLQTLFQAVLDGEARRESADVVEEVLHHFLAVYR
jgi:hypothetical protein